MQGCKARRRQRKLMNANITSELTNSKTALRVNKTVRTLLRWIVRSLRSENCTTLIRRKSEARRLMSGLVLASSIL